MLGEFIETTIEEENEQMKRLHESLVKIKQAEGRKVTSITVQVPQK
jgi:hypothetical protein